MSSTVPGSVNGSISEAYEKSAATPKPPTLGDWRRKQRCSPFVVANVCIGVGLLLVILSIVYSTVMPTVINSKINDGVTTCSDADIAKEEYLDPYGDCEDCVPYYYNLYMFNVTNAEDYLEKGDKLKVQELGPYAYRRRELKVDVKLDGDEVSYKQYSYHVFDKERSCETCSDTDMVTSWDIGYLNIVAHSGGEFSYLSSLIRGTLWGSSISKDDVGDVIKANGTEIMRYVNGLNSNNPKAWHELGSSILVFFGSGLSVLKKMDLSGPEFNGVFATRPVSDHALGFPSLLVGLALGAHYNRECKVTGGYNDQCASCKGDSCLAIWDECIQCQQAKAVITNNDAACAMVKAKYAAVYGEEAAATFASTACGQCDSLGLCAAMLPGAAERSGLDYSKRAPSPDALNTFIQKTGCDDKSKIGEYVQYDGMRTTAYWATMDKRRNPTLAELNGFSVYGNCANKLDNMTCSDVSGADGKSFPPGGASIMGFPDSVDEQETQMFLIQAYQNITLVNTGEIVDDLDGIALTRFTPPNDLLSLSKANQDMGTGFPVNGVQSLAFVTGFLAYLSYPMFIYGDESLTEGVEITMTDGVVASRDTMFDGDTLKPEYFERYHTIVDVDPATGKTMRARKALMASYALSESTYNRGSPMTDVLWPDLKIEVISPAYVGMEVSIVTAHKIDKYNTLKTLLATLLPVLIAGVVVGMGLFAAGIFYRRRAQYHARRNALAEVF